MTFTTLFSRLAMQGVARQQFWPSICSFCSNIHTTSKQHRERQRNAAWAKDTNATKNDTMEYTNPLDRLQPFVEVPLVDESDLVFRPSTDEMKKAACFFGADFSHAAITHKGTIHAEDMQNRHMPEVAFMGESNVGKSSLIKALFRHIPEIDVYISSKPGHTTVLRGFSIKGKFSLVDMPGYGFNMPKHYGYSVDKYLKTRRNLKTVLLLVDGKMGLTECDMVAVKMLEEFGRSYVLVYTKIDLASPTELITNVLHGIDQRESVAPGCLPQPFLVSSKTCEGLALLKTFLAYTTGNIALENL